VATKKQRRRRQKERRHDYEFVYVDDAGEEVEVDEPEPKPREPRQTSGIKPTPGAKKQPAAKTTSRSERVVEPPSWDRTFRRAAIFVPIMLIFLYFTRPKNYSTAAMVLQGLFIIVLLILFMYGMDHFLYRSYLKRTGKSRDGGSAPKSK
jgi:hypothetical protein